MHRIRATTVAFTLAALLLAGCSDDDPKVADPPVSTSSGTSSSAATDEPTEKPVEPVLPDAAKKATEAGAKAFVEHYWELINYAQATGDVKALNAETGPQCGGCIGISDSLRDLHKNGGAIEGGENSLSALKATEVDAGSGYVVEVEFDLTHAAETVTLGDGSVEKNAQTKDPLVAALTWSGDQDGWRLDVMDYR